jgi:hypothetical protein
VSEVPNDAADRLVVRTLMVAALAGVFVVHLIDLPNQAQQVPYLAAGYLVVMAASAWTMAGWVVGPQRRHRLGAVAVGLGPLMAYVISRSPVGLPLDAADKGNWADPLGLVSLFAGAVVVLLAVQWLRLGEDSAGVRQGRGATKVMAFSGQATTQSPQAWQLSSRGV